MKFKEISKVRSDLLLNLYYLLKLASVKLIISCLWWIALCLLLVVEGKGLSKRYDL